MVAFVLLAVEPVGYVISGQTHQVWTATRIQRTEGGIPGGLSIPISDSDSTAAEAGPNESGGDSAVIQRQQHGIVKESPV